MKKVGIVLFIVTLWVGAANAAQLVIGVNFYESSTTADRLAGETADGLNNWTDSTGSATGTGLVVLGTDGLVTCDWSSANTWRAGTSATSEEQLYHAYLDDGSGGAKITIRGLNAWMRAVGASSYIVRIYQNTDHVLDSTYYFGPTQITDGTNVLQTVQVDQSKEWTTNNSDQRGLVDSDKLSKDMIVLAATATVSGATVRGCVSGIKITAVIGTIAQDPNPEDGAIDVPRDAVLSWKPGINADTHNVFIGTDFNDVNNATIGNPLGVTVSEGQALDVNYFNPGTLEFGKTYYWRVDEVNAPSKPGTFKGQIWQFTTEPYALKVPAANIKATAKHSASNNDPNNTINEKGFKDANHPDWHDISLGMWLSGKTEVNNPAWIMYEFSELYKIHEMFVWNHNAKIGTGGSGFKSTIIEYSEDGQAWTQLTTTQFNRGPGRIDYVYNTTVPFNGAVAKYVRITALGNWANNQNGAGLSEVRFTYIPVRARKPSPDTGSVDVPLNRVLTWRAGREALTHNVYISTNEQSVTSRSSGVHTVSQASYTPSSLELNRTYYWRVDEVNTLEVPSLWETDVWSFSTPAYILVEGFETGYDDSDANAVWATWTGWEDLTNGGAMGNPGIPYLSTTNHSGGHSSPMFYNNGKAGVVKSEVIAQTANLPIGTTNWTLGNPDTLVIWFRGDPNNPVTDKMYVKLNSTKINYGGAVEDIKRTVWTKWEVPLTGINLGNISSLTIGMEKIGSTGGSGVLYLDDIQLTISVPASDPGTANLVAKYNMENNVQDSSGHNLNGTLKGTVNGGPTYQAGIYGQALVFDGNDDCVDLGKNAAFNPTGSFSVSLWAKITTWSSAWGYVMVGNRGEDNVGWQIRRYSDNRFSFTTRGISNDDMNSRANAPLNEWVNITCVYDSAARTKSIYINGALERSVNMTGTVTQIPATTHNTYIGARANSANTGQENFFAGMLDKILIYDKALSEGEVEYIYKN